MHGSSRCIAAAGVIVHKHAKCHAGYRNGNQSLEQTRASVQSSAKRKLATVPFRENCDLSTACNEIWQLESIVPNAKRCRM